MAIDNTRNTDIDGLISDSGLTVNEYIQKIQMELVQIRLSRDAWVREWQNERLLADVLRDALLFACGSPGGLILAGPPLDAIKQYDLLRK